MKKIIHNMRKAEIFFAAGLVVFLVVFVFVSWSETRKESSALAAGQGIDVLGWIWSENTGWISMSCQNQGVCATSDYGVLFSHTTRESSGYAWSDNLGWISFNAADVVGCPSGSCTARLDPNGNLLGWARILSSIGEASDGWVSFSCQNGGNCATSNYQVAVAEDGSFNGFAWGNIVSGWISFSDDSDGTPGPSTYEARLAPEAPTVTPTGTSIIYCTDNRVPIFNFTYDLSNFYNMQSYEITVTKIGDILPVATITGNVIRLPGETQSVTYVGPTLIRGESYNWNVKVTNFISQDSPVTEMAGSPDFFIEVNRRPVVDFTWSPVFIVPNLDTLFTSTGVAQCFTGDILRDCAAAFGDTFFWDIADSVYQGTDDATVADPTVQFLSSGDKIISLSITGDNTGGPCTETKNSGELNVNKPIPEFQEQRP